VSWSLKSVSCTDIGEYDTADLYGNKVRLEFLLRHLPGLRKKLDEMPALEWKEKIIVLDHARHQRWEFSTDMYQHNPNSRTLSIWSRRYIEADKTLSASVLYRGQSQLLNLKMQRVTLDTGHAPSDQDRAEAVRKYLAKEGGFLRISIEDIPSIRRQVATGAQPAHTERLLLADCGVAGAVYRQRWSQHIDLDQSLPSVQWRRRCESRWFQSNLPTPAGFATVPPPPGVSTIRTPTRTYGEYP
jgi:hypothetical protein